MICKDIEFILNLYVPEEILAYKSNKNFNRERDSILDENDKLEKCIEKNYLEYGSYLYSETSEKEFYLKQVLWTDNLDMLKLFQDSFSLNNLIEWFSYGTKSRPNIAKYLYQYLDSSDLRNLRDNVDLYKAGNVKYGWAEIFKTGSNRIGAYILGVEPSEETKLKIISKMLEKECRESVLVDLRVYYPKYADQVDTIIENSKSPIYDFRNKRVRYNLE